MKLQVSFVGPASALVTLPVTADREGVLRTVVAEREAWASIEGLRSTVPAFNRLLVEGSPDRWDEDEVRTELAGAVRTALAKSISDRTEAPVELPVCYDPELGADLVAVAERSGLSVVDVVSRHSARTYTVLATGFTPGFAYLGDLDAALAIPRRAQPRLSVPAGSVAIADRRTGVYPVASPGGWRLLGRVPAKLFFDNATRLNRFAPGGSVRFRPVGLSDYEAEAG